MGLEVQEMSKGSLGFEEAAGLIGQPVVGPRRVWAMAKLDAGLYRKELSPRGRPRPGVRVGRAGGPGGGKGRWYLEGTEQHVRRTGQGSQQGCGGGANVGAQEERVRPLQADHPDPWGSQGSVPRPELLPPRPRALGLSPALTHERHNGRCEDTAALKHKGQAGAHEDSQVAAEPAEREGEVYGGVGGGSSSVRHPPQPTSPCPRSGRTSIDDLPHGLGHAAMQHRVEQLDDEQEAGAEQEQGGRQQDEARGQVRECGPHKQVVAWGRGRVGEPRAAPGAGGDGDGDGPGRGAGGLTGQLLQHSGAVALRAGAGAGRSAVAAVPRSLGRRGRADSGRAQGRRPEQFSRSEAGVRGTSPSPPWCHTIA